MVKNELFTRLKRAKADGNSYASKLLRDVKKGELNVVKAHTLWRLSVQLPIASCKLDPQTQREMGQYFTTDPGWLKPHLVDFVKSRGLKTAVDPFVGSGDLLRLAKLRLGVKPITGYDNDPAICEAFGWEQNDSLSRIPPTEFIISNPPFCAKNSAKRRGLKNYEQFKGNDFEDLYQIAIESILKASEYSMIIVPESVVQSGRFRERMFSITVIEKSPFTDTDVPICVLTFVPESVSDTEVYVNATYIGTMKQLEVFEKTPKSDKKIIFNATLGNLGLKAVDGGTPENRIAFCPPEEIKGAVIVSSRNNTLINVDEGVNIPKLIRCANKILERYRKETSDILLTPFKGNNNKGKRRRRLDFRTARAIIEEALNHV